MYEYILKKLKNIVKPSVKELTDEEIFVKIVLKEENMTWEEAVDILYEKGDFGKKYKTLKEALLDNGMAEEQYNEQMKSIRASEEYKAYIEGPVTKYEEQINNMSGKVEMIYPNEIGDWDTIPVKEATYIITLKYEGEECDIKIKIDQYEMVMHYGQVYALDVRNKKALRIKNAKVIVDDQEIEIDSKYLIEENGNNYLATTVPELQNRDSYCWTILECDEGIIEGYAYYNIK